MAESLLRTWNAPSLVTSVVIDAGAKPSADSANTDITGLDRAKGKITTRVSWMQADKALPLPFPHPDVDPVLALVLKYSDIVLALDQETLQIRDLTSEGVRLANRWSQDWQVHIAKAIDRNQSCHHGDPHD